MTASPPPPSALFPAPDCRSAQRIAERSVEIWLAVARELLPLIGERGFDILFARCLHLTQAAHPWLAPDPPEPGAQRFAGLAGALAGRDPAEALAASEALLATFHDTLAVLIGAPLTNGILRAIRGYGPLPAKEIPS